MNAYISMERSASRWLSFAFLIPNTSIYLPKCFDHFYHLANSDPGDSPKLSPVGKLWKMVEITGLRVISLEGQRSHDLYAPNPWHWWRKTPRLVPWFSWPATCTGQSSLPALEKASHWYKQILSPGSWFPHTDVATGCVQGTKKVCYSSQGERQGMRPAVEARAKIWRLMDILLWSFILYWGDSTGRFQVEEQYQIPILVRVDRTGVRWVEQIMSPRDQLGN